MQGLFTHVEGLEKASASPAVGRQLNPVSKGQRGLGWTPRAGVLASLCAVFL